MAYQIDYAYTCHTGKVRTNNEDNFWCCGVRLPVHNQGVDGILAGHTQHWQHPMLAVFDGMGGESYGEMAASAAVEALGGFYEENKKTLKKEPVVFLTGACENMNEAVCRYSNENGIRSMGTTMALLSFSEKAIYACNLGDSRIYRHFQGKFQQISTDHVIGGKMLGKAPLTQYLGFQEENLDRCDTLQGFDEKITEDLHDGDGRREADSDQDADHQPARALLDQCHAGKRMLDRFELNNSSS